MAWRLYVIPITGSGSSRLDPRRPAYVVEAGLDWAAMDYGQVPWGLVAANVTTPQHNALVANADVTAFPANLQTTIGANLATVQAALEAARLPAGWVAASDTYATVARTVAGLMQFAQRYTALSGGQELVPASINLNTQFGSLSAQRQADLLATADSLGYDRTGLQATTTLRAILKNLADQWGARPFVLGGMVF